MPTPEALQALIRLRKENEQNNEYSNINQYNVDEPDEVVDRFANSLLAQQGLPEPETDRNLGLLKDAGETLYKSAVAGGYEFIESAGFGLPGLGEAGLKRFADVDLGIQETAREFQEESSLAAIVGGIGTGAGYLVGLPVKGSLAVARGLGRVTGVTERAIRQFGGQTLRTATKSASKVAKQSGLDKKIVNDFSNKLATEATKLTARSQKASTTFADSFSSNIGKYIGREMKLGRMTADQAKVIRNMQKAVLEKGVPVQNLQQLATLKYGNTFMGRVIPELLNDAFVFSVADFTLDLTQQGQNILRDETKDFGDIDYAEALKSAGYGFIGGSVINIGTAPFKALSKMNKSRADFIAGVAGYLGKNTYKNKDLGYLSKQLAHMADMNNMNGMSSILKTKDSNINFYKINLANRELAHKGIERELVREFGDDAKNQAIKYLMSQRKMYSKEIIKEARKEAWENYKSIWGRMAWSGILMGGVSAFEASMRGYEVEPEDLISSFIIGSFMQRRGNFAKADMGPRIQRLRDSLQALDVPVQNTSFASSLDVGGERFGVGLARDNAELTAYLKEQRIVSDTDETITNERLRTDLGEESFLDYDVFPGQSVDPTNGKFEAIHSVLRADFKHVKSQDQFSKEQVDEIFKIFKSQGLDSIDDFRKATDEKVDVATTGLEKSIVSVLEDINGAGLADLNIVSNRRGIITPKDFAASNDLLKRARDGEFKEWLGGKEGQEAETEITDMLGSLEMVAEVSTSLNNATANKQSKNTIVSAESLKSVYNIVRDSERAIDDGVQNFDGRRAFKFTEIESYIMPIIRNKSNKITNSVMDVFSPDRVDDKLSSLLEDVGILQDGKIIDNYSEINSKSGRSSELEKIHGIIKTIGKYDLTDEITNRNVEDDRIDDLKNYLNTLGLPVDTINKPNLKFIYHGILNDINRTRLDNAVTNVADVNFIIKFSGNKIFSRPGVISDKGIRGFSFVKVDIPSDPQLEKLYNNKIRRLKEDTEGLVKVVDSPIIIKNPTTISELEKTLISIYGGVDRTQENIKLKELFDVMSNSNLDAAKDRMKNYISKFGEEGQIDILTMLKTQGIIKRVNKDLELVNDNILLENFEEIDKFIVRQSSDDTIIENEIKKRREIDRLYIGDASDVVKNPSVNVNDFHDKYNFKHRDVDPDGGFEFRDFSREDISKKRENFNDIYERTEDGKFQVTDDSINRFYERVAIRSKEFSRFNKQEKNRLVQDVTQILFGEKDKDFIKKLKIENGKVLFDDKQEVIQDNPVNKYFKNLGIGYAFFDNNVLVKEPGYKSDVPTERLYNILQTESVPDDLVDKISEIRKSVAQDLAQHTITKEDGFGEKFDRNDRSDGDSIADRDIVQTSEVGIKKLDIYDGMDSIVIKTTDVKKIVEDFTRFYDEYTTKKDSDGNDLLNPSTKKALDTIKKSFDETIEENLYDDFKVELATRYLILETGFKSKENKLLYEIMNSSDSEFVDKYTKRIKLYSTKSFVRPTEDYIKQLLIARKPLGRNKASKLLKKRLDKKGHRVAIWDDDTESMSRIIKETVEEFKGEYPELENYNLENIIGGAHSRVSGFDSIAYISKERMMEYHTLMGHSPDSTNPIKPVISSQGEGKTLLYGKTLLVHSPALEGFFNLNKDVDILLTKSGAKAYDGGDDTIMTGLRWDELSSFQIRENKNKIIRKIDIDGIGFRPEKDANLLSASEGVGDYNYMDIGEHARAFEEIRPELEENLDYMMEIIGDPYKLNSFMQQKMRENNIPEDSNEGSLQHLSTLMYYLKLNDSTADPMDYSMNQVQKYLAKEYIDNLFTTRRSITSRIKSEIDEESFRYGGQAPIIQSAIGHLGGGRKTRLLPTLFDKNNKKILTGQIMLPHEERGTRISVLSKEGKNIRILQNTKTFTIDEFIEDIKGKIPKSDEKYFTKDLLTENSTIESVHEFLQAASEITNTRYELGIISRRNPRTRPDDITLLGLKGFLPKDSGLAVEVNSWDIVNTYEGDYDADKVDYFFAHSDFMFDYIKRNQAFHVQGIDPKNAQSPSNFTFQLDAKSSNKTMLKKIGTSIGYKRGIGIVQKTPRKINYLQNLANDDYLFDSVKREKWDLNIKQNEETGNFDGPGLLYKSGDDEFVTVDTRTLAYYQRSAYETQYILDGANKLNPNISSNIYEWADDFLFPDNRSSISPLEARASDLKDILANGQNAEGKRVRIFQKFKLDKESNKYKATEDLNEADKLVLREFLSQQNKLLNAFGDKSYSDGNPRKTTFYDLQIGAKNFREFHKNIYDSLAKQLKFKRKVLKKDDQKYLDALLDKKQGRFKSIDKKTRDIYDGNGGGYLDRIAVQIAKKDLFEERKQYTLDTSVYLQIENWFDSLISSPSNYKDSKEQSEDRYADYEQVGKEQREDLDKFTQDVVADTRSFNKSIASIKRLANKKEIIRKSSYGWKWKKSNINKLDYVINKLKEKFQEEYKKDISKINPSDLKYKEYISVDDSNLKRSLIHANTLSALLKSSPRGYQYDSWTESLTKEQRADLDAIKSFNKQTLGSNTLLDELLPFGQKKSILTNRKMIDYVAMHSSGISNVFELRQKYLLEKIEQHGLKFIFAYMEPIRNKDAIGVFNNRPISIPYKESKRYSHGIQVLAGIASGKKTIGKDFETQMELKESSQIGLDQIIKGNDYYRKFFNKDVSIRSEKDMMQDKVGLMAFDKDMQRRIKNNSQFNWLSESLPTNDFSTINKSVIGMYRDYVELMPNKTDEDYINFLTKLNDIEEYMYKRDYVNPIKYIEKRLSLDEDFEKLSKKKIYDIEGDDGEPESLKNNKLYKFNKYIKFEPTLVKKPKRLLNVLKSFSEVETSLVNGVRQMPFKDSGKEKILRMREAQDCL